MLLYILSGTVHASMPLDVLSDTHGVTLWKHECLSRKWNDEHRLLNSRALHIEIYTMFVGWETEGRWVRSSKWNVHMVQCTLVVASIPLLERQADQWLTAWGFSKRDCSSDEAAKDTDVDICHTSTNFHKIQMINLLNYYTVQQTFTLLR
jgi:hypothetical protein